jgi:hypothetical protein
MNSLCITFCPFFPRGAYVLRQTTPRAFPLKMVGVLGVNDEHQKIDYGNGTN